MAVDARNTSCSPVALWSTAAYVHWMEGPPSGAQAALLCGGSVAKGAGEAWLATAHITVADGRGAALRVEEPMPDAPWKCRDPTPESVQMSQSYR